MGFIDFMKQFKKEEYNAAFKIRGLIYYENNFWFFLGKKQNRTYIGEIIPNKKSGHSKYIVAIQGKRIGYFPAEDEKFITDNLNKITKIEVELSTNEAKNLHGTIRITYTE